MKRTRRGCARWTLPTWSTRRCGSWKTKTAWRPYGAGTGNSLTSVRGRYRQIFVDECQDVSAVQNALIDRLAGEENTLFMVGDVKQSIYRFRLANPNLFRERIEAEGPEAGERIFLQENFRSRPEILQTANTIFRDVMHTETAGIEYEEKDELRAGRTDCPGLVPVEVDLAEQGEGMTVLETVAAHTADRIREMKEAGEFDYRDMVILMPEVSTDGPKISELLKQQGIPVFFDGKGGFFEQPEVEVFRNLLMLLDNPHLDLPLLTVLVNPPFAFPEEELSLIRLKKTGRNVPFWQAFEETAGEDSPLGLKCRRAAEQLESWRFKAARMRLNDFLWYLLDESGIYAIYGAGDKGSAAQKNLRSFCLQADRAAERSLCALREFLDGFRRGDAGRFGFGKRGQPGPDHDHAQVQGPPVPGGVLPGAGQRPERKARRIGETGRGAGPVPAL